MMLSKVFTRKNILTLLAVIVYFFVMSRTLWGGYNTVGLLGATLGGHTLMILLITVLSIERQDVVSKKVFRYSIVSLMLLICLLGFIQGMRKGLGIVARNTAYLVYGFVTWTFLVNQKKISLWTFTTSGLSLFSALLSIGYVMVFLSYAKPFDIDCNNLKQQTVGILTQYFPSSLSGSSTIMSTIEQFGNKTLGQLVGVGSGSVYPTTDTISGSSKHPTTLLSTIELYKKNLVDDFIANKSIVDQGACDFTLAHIQKITANSTFQISAVILLTLLILVFINTLYIVFGVVVFIIIVILYKTSVYTITTKKQNCEKLS